MSLGRLLTSGKSLVGLNDGDCRYQMRAKNLLPKFGSDKNPFLNAKRSVAPVAPAHVAPQSLQSEFSRRLPAATVTPVESTPAQATAEVKSEKTTTATASETKAMKPSVFSKLNLILKKLNPLNWRGEKGRSSSSQIEKTPVQTELSLDRIKVVRNDLSEADVEIVPVKIAVQPKPAQAGVKVAPSAQPATPELIKT